MCGPGFRLVRFAVLLFAVFCWPGRTQVALTSPVQSILKEGDRAFAQGDYDAARRSFEKALQIAQQLPADSPIRYDVLKRLTSTSAASGKFAEAERYLQQAVEWRESTIGANDPKIADDLLLSVNLNMRTEEFDRALANAQRVQAMHVEALTSESIPVADDLVRIGQNLSRGKETERSGALPGNRDRRPDKARGFARPWAAPGSGRAQCSFQSNRRRRQRRLVSRL